MRAGCDGNYAVLLPEEGSYSVEVQGEDASDVRFQLTVPPGVEAIEFPMNLPKSGISGLVVDAASGQPLAEATVAAMPIPQTSRPPVIGDRRWKGWAHAAEGGRFTFSHLPAGRYDLWTWSQGRASLRSRGIVVEAGTTGEPLRIALETEVKVSLLVLDGRGFPVANAVGYMQDPEGNVLPGAWLRSDAAGRCKVEGLGRSVYTLTVLHRAFAPTRIELPASTAEPLVVRLDSGGILQLQTVDTSGRPVEGIGIELIDEDRAVSISWRRAWRRDLSDWR